MNEQVKKLYRSKTDRIVFGVCGGMAKYFDSDPTLVRLLFVLLTLVNGIGIVIYIILAIILPEEAAGQESDRSEKVKEFVGEVGERAKELAGGIKDGEGKWFMNSRNLLGLIIVLIGLSLLFEKIFPKNWFDWSFVWPVIIIILGLYFLLKNKK